MHAELLSQPADDRLRVRLAPQANRPRPQLVGGTSSVLPQNVPSHGHQTMIRRLREPGGPHRARTAIRTAQATFTCPRPGIRVVAAAGGHPVSRTFESCRSHADPAVTYRHTGRADNRRPTCTSGSPLGQGVAVSFVLRFRVAGPGCDLSVEAAVGIGPSAPDCRVAPDCPPGPVPFFDGAHQVLEGHGAPLCRH